MSTEVKEKIEGGKSTVATRLEIPLRIHRKIVKHQYRLTGEKGESVTLAAAAVDLLDRATKSIR